MPRVGGPDSVSVWGAKILSVAPESLNTRTKRFCMQQPGLTQPGKLKERNGKLKFFLN